MSHHGSGVRLAHRCNNPSHKTHTQVKPLVGGVNTTHPSPTVNTHKGTVSNGATLSCTKAKDEQPGPLLQPPVPVQP